MEPNIYAPPTSEPISSEEYQAALKATGRSVSWGIKLATILASVASASLTVWCTILFGVATEVAAAASVGGVGPSLTLTGHAVFLAFGGIIGLVIGIIVLAISLDMEIPTRHSPHIVPILAAAIASVLSFVCLCLVGGIFFAPPRELMDLLFR